MEIGEVKKLNKIVDEIGRIEKNLDLLQKAMDNILSCDGEPVVFNFITAKPKKEKKGNVLDSEGNVKSEYGGTGDDSYANLFSPSFWRPYNTSKGVEKEDGDFVTLPDYIALAVIGTAERAQQEERQRLLKELNKI